MAAFEIFEPFLSEKQNRGMLFECLSSHQETARAERPPNSVRQPSSAPSRAEPTRFVGDWRIRRRANEGGNFPLFPPRKALKTRKARKESRRGGASSPTRRSQSRACPEMAPQGLEKIESAPGNGRVSEASDPQDVVHRRAADLSDRQPQSRSVPQSSAVGGDSSPRRTRRKIFRLAKP
jgi:hypothetical protein